jgi:hypothetical protein
LQITEDFSSPSRKAVLQILVVPPGSPASPSINYQPQFRTWGSVSVSLGPEFKQQSTRGGRTHFFFPFSSPPSPPFEIHWAIQGHRLQARTGGLLTAWRGGNRWELRVNAVGDRRKVSGFDWRRRPLTIPRPPGPSAPPLLCSLALPLARSSMSFACASFLLSKSVSEALGQLY